MGTRNRLFAVVLAASAGLGTAVPAQAKVWFGDVARGDVRWGDRVTAEIANCRGNASCTGVVRGMEVFVRHGKSSWQGIEEDQLHRVGTVDGSGRVTFEMPSAAPGDYHLVAKVAINGAHQYMAASATFRVRAKPGPVRIGCRNHSSADFPGAFRDRRNFVVGPLVLVGARSTDAATVRRFGGNKIPALLAAGHTATIEIPRAYAGGARVAYGPAMPWGRTHLRDGYEAIALTACGRDVESGSRVDGRPVTFWSGFVLSSKPQCIPLRVSIDGEPARLHRLPLGARC